MGWILFSIFALLAIALYDITQKKHAILRNFPIIGHFRYLFEKVGPELRQYIVTNNDEERPFTRDQRRWVYASSKHENNYFGFGTDNDLECAPNYLILKPAAFPYSPDTPPDEKYLLPSAKILGASRGRKKAFRPNSIVNISGMSFGSLSSAAVEAINRGCEISDCLHNSGEGGLSSYHQCGGELIWQIGTGYFGCRDSSGRFCLETFLEKVEKYPVKAIEIKLSQGAKPGRGGVLPASKISPEIASIRGIPLGQDCVSPAGHSAFHDVDSMLDFVENLAEQSGLPIGIKSAVGELDFWKSLATQMKTSRRGVDFITIDGGEGGTGAAPLAFSDHVALPFKIGFSRVFRIFAEQGLNEDVVFIGAGRLGFPIEALFGMALGCDMINVGREAMLAIGCIQAQRCHTGHCPTGVATQSKWLVRGLDPSLKAARLANYVLTLRKELSWLSHAAGVSHPALVDSDHFEIVDEHFGARSVRELFQYEPEWTRPSPSQAAEINQLV